MRVEALAGSSSGVQYDAHFSSRASRIVLWCVRGALEQIIKLTFIRVIHAQLIYGGRCRVRIGLRGAQTALGSRVHSREAIATMFVVSWREF